MPQIAQSLALARHSASRGDAIHRIDARVFRTSGGTLDITYVASGATERLRIPPRTTPRPADRLWQHTCFEVFARSATAHGYHELNFSPSGEWAVYAFERYREGVPLTDAALDPQVSVVQRAGALEVRAAVPLERLLPQRTARRLELALCAVIEEADGALSYWALCHPGDQPDFHHPDSYALTLQD